ncbi:DUF262 domain-containing protein [Ectopseudomonas mendocina]|uniref:GmrSD restriction endonucleases N-terminal domain-containing protein n=1 Tax=Ectopseudomonas mendocina S5.2 TaxID=1225174 RepID=A0ABM5W3J6_ECTME|nr:DUF262 domain-containing protein [Pseudomonas mendocina]ALN21825.1 hypothetical protein DW68_024410 [Pseudomonas mendocina S5.2]KER98120.1 hypothetical protein HN51_25310 [Pseudomonas mendocina]
MTIQLPSPLLEGCNRQYDIDLLTRREATKITREGERQLMCWVLPVWQRDPSWSEEQQIRFIEGIFLGLGTGYYVVHGSDWHIDGEVKPMSGWLIDGQQRITAIKKFLDGELAIFDGIRFGDLDRPTQLRRFLRMPFPCIELEYQEDEERLKELYKRLCFGGTPHTAADLARLG